MGRVLVLALLLLPAPAFASQITMRWDLHDVTFDDGATLTGYFSLDTDEFGQPRRKGYIIPSKFSLTTTSGPIVRGFTYADGPLMLRGYGDRTCAQCDYLAFFDYFDRDHQERDHVLVLIFTASLLTPGTVSVVAGPHYSEYDYGTDHGRSITGGYATGTQSVPEPRVLLMLGAGAIAIRKRFRLPGRLGR